MFTVKWCFRFCSIRPKSLIQTVKYWVFIDKIFRENFGDALIAFIWFFCKDNLFFFNGERRPESIVKFLRTVLCSVTESTEKKISSVLFSTFRWFKVKNKMHNRLKSTVLLQENFADWRFFVVCGNKFLRFEMTEISPGKKILRLSFQAAAEHLSGRETSIFNFYCTVSWVTVHSTYVLETYQCNTSQPKGTLLNASIYLRYRLPCVSRLWFLFRQWKIMLMFLFKSNVYRPSDTSH